MMREMYQVTKCCVFQWMLCLNKPNEDDSLGTTVTGRAAQLLCFLGDIDLRPPAHSIIAPVTRVTAVTV